MSGDECYGCRFNSTTLISLYTVWKVISVQFNTSILSKVGCRVSRASNLWSIKGKYSRFRIVISSCCSLLSAFLSLCVIAQKLPQLFFIFFNSSSLHLKCYYFGSFLLCITALALCCASTFCFILAWICLPATMLCHRLDHSSFLSGGT